MAVALGSDVQRLTDAVEDQLRNGWVKWPGGHVGQIELALIDAVFSIRAKYGQAATDTRRASGVQAVVARWKQFRGVTTDDLTAIAGHDEAAFLDICDNRTLTSGRTKASAVQEAARGLLVAGVRSSSDFEIREIDARAACVATRGLGDVTFNYLRMLLGLQDVKADTWVVRFVEGAIGRPVAPAETSALMHAAAAVFAQRPETCLPTTPSDLDHAIWYFQSQHRAS